MDTDGGHSAVCLDRLTDVTIIIIITRNVKRSSLIQIHVLLQRHLVEITSSHRHGTRVITFALTKPIDILNKDCRRSCSAILTRVPENVKISARPLNSIGN